MNDNKIPPVVEILKGEEDLLLDHNYDGIHELNHVLPKWWLGILYGTILFAAWYMGYYMSGHGPTSRQELAADLRAIEALKPAATNGTPESDKQNLLAAFKNPARLKQGQEVFSGKCLACHGDKGQGLIGPNLTDDFWLQGKGTLQDIAEVVTIGVPEKGMPPWGPVLTNDELADVVEFVRSIRGSNPAGAKASQGIKQESQD